MLSVPVSPFETSRIDHRLSWRDNLFFASPNSPQPRKNSEIDRVILDSIANTPLRETLIRCGFDYRVGKGGRRLSGGQRQMVCLGRALLRDVKIYILDEPTAALDPNSRNRVHKFLQEHSKQATIIAITHDPELASMSGKVIMMRDGALQATGKYKTLMSKNAVFRNVIGDKGV